MSSKRLDEELVARGLVPTRARARDAILRDTVLVDGVPARKPSQNVLSNTVLVVDDPALKYVSRAALKLLHGLSAFSVDAKGRVAVDLGASTGGFSQVLLEHGATHVVAIDVGHDQLAEKLRHDRRVTVIEGLNARDISPDVIPTNVSLIVCDVSFISLKIALMPLINIVPQGTELIALIKPQFEVGKAKLGKGGVVRESSFIVAACDEISEFMQLQNWEVKAVVPSPLEGGDGNQEFLLHGRKMGV